MALTPVTLAPSLRAWASAGITHILFDAPVHVPATLSLCQNSAPTEGNKPSVQRFAPDAPKTTPTQRDAAPADSNVRSSPPVYAFAPRDGVARDPADWPQPWADWFGKISSAPILWTYHELGADLTGIGRSSERSSFFRGIITELRLAKGSSVFWPCAMPDARSPQSSEPLADPAIFSAGLARLSPQLIVVFGKKALEDLGLPFEGTYFRQVIVEGRLLLVLPEIGDLIEGVAQRSSALSLLRAVVASIQFTS